jgi:undecaprenyl-diphosphatase
MSLLDALILALVQGLTEFLPVSSSGHLAIAKALLGAAGQDGVFYEVLLHVATMLAVVVFFRRELWALTSAFGRSERAPVARRVLLLLAISSVPTALIGLGVKDLAEKAFELPPWVGAGLLLTSLMLLSTLALRRKRDDEDPEADVGEWIADLAEIRPRDAAVVGVAQGIAVWPGISRSGSTIAAALLMGVRPLPAARFSLLASLPAIGGGFVLELRELESLPLSLGPQLAGSVVGFGVGWLAIGWLMAAVRGTRLAWYALYTAILGLACIASAFWA